MNKRLLKLALAAFTAASLTNCACNSSSQPTANIIHGTPSGGAMPIYVMATYRDLKAGGLAAGWFRGWTQAEFEFLRLYPDHKICVREVQTPACREQMPIALVAVPKRYLTGEIPGSLALYHIMSGTGDLLGGVGNLLSGVAWFRGVEIGISGDPLATASASAEGGSGYGSSSATTSSSSASNSGSYSNSNSRSNSSAYNNSTSGGKGGHGHGGGGKDKGGDTRDYGGDKGGKTGDTGGDIKNGGKTGY